jgi:hypothetical protein
MNSKSDSITDQQSILNKLKKDVKQLAMILEIIH